MRILHLAAGNRWTGAAAPAFAEVESLRSAGVDAHYAFVGGYRLEEKLAHLDYAHPVIEKSQDPVSFARSISRINRLIREHRFDIIHSHLSYDHLVAQFTSRGKGVRLARTFHSRRVLRRDPFSHWLMARTDLLFVINETFTNHRALRGRQAVFTPPPLDHRQFTPQGPDVRALYGFPPGVKIVAVIGKVSPGRGFEEALQTYAALRHLQPATHLMIIGHGEHRPFLQNLSRTLGIAEHVSWTGYHEEDLAEHYRAADLLLFTARGSDEGHRAVLEAMASGVPAVSYPLDGITPLVGEAMVAAAPSPESLAALASSVLARDGEALRREVYDRSLAFGYAEAAKRLIAGYSR